MDNKGQSVLAEHAMIFFVAIAALVAMTTFVQRGFEARIHDARNFMINEVMNSNVCDANCVAATGNIYYEYEPYYELQLSDVATNESDRKVATTGNAQVLGGVYANSINETTTTNSAGCQLPAICSDPDQANESVCQCNSI